MLKLLRHKSTQKKIYIGLAIVVSLSFVISGVLITDDGGKADAALATLGKRRYTVQDYLNSYRAVQNQATWMYGDKLAEMRGRINFKGEAWDRLLLLDHAKKQGIRAADEEVIKWVATQPAFQKDGKLDEAFYHMYIERALRSTPRAFEEDIRQMLTIQKIVDSLDTTTSLTDPVVKEKYAQERSEKSIVTWLLPWEDLQDQVPVTDKDIEPLYEMVKDKLTKTEEVDGKKTERPMTMEETKTDLTQQFKRPKATELALKRLTEIKAKAQGADLEAALKAEKIDAMPFEKYTKGMYPSGMHPSEALAMTVATLKEGEISEPFEVPKGAMLVKLLKVSDIDEKKFEEEKEAYKKSLVSQQTTEAVNGLLEKLRGELKLNLELMKEIFPSDV